LKNCRASAPLAELMAGDAPCPTSYFAFRASRRQNNEQRYQRRHGCRYIPFLDSWVPG